MAAYRDTNGNEWPDAESALAEFLSDLPDLTEDETETVFQFTDHAADAATNLAAIAHGVTYAGMDHKFSGDNYPVPTPVRFYLRYGPLRLPGGAFYPTREDAQAVADATPAHLGPAVVCEAEV